MTEPRANNIQPDLTASLLAVLFIGLKLTGNITWSWWWVTSPIWGPPAVVLVAMLVFTLIGVISRPKD